MSVVRKRSGPSLKAQLSLAIAKILSQLTRILPLPLAYFLADRSSDLTYLLFRTYRRNVTENVVRVVGSDKSAKEIRAIVRKTFRYSGRNFYDLLRVPQISSDELARLVTFSDESKRHLDNVLEQRRGGLVVTAHFGAFDFVGQILWENGYELTSLTTRTVPEFLYAVVTYLRATRGLALEEATPGGVRRVLIKLKRGGLVGLLSDRDFFQNGLPVTFFGHQTTLPSGAVRLARETGAPIVPLFAERLERGYRLTVEPPFHIHRTDDPRADMIGGLQQIVTRYEHYIKSAPEQWVMFQRVWAEEPQQVLRVFPVGSPLEGDLLGRGAKVGGALTAPAASEKSSTGDADGLNDDVRSSEIPSTR